MKLGDLEFTPDDFLEYFKGAVDPSVCFGAAMRANRLLAERLEKAPIVSSYVGGITERWADWHNGMPGPCDADTHTARLVCIEELRK